MKIRKIISVMFILSGAFMLLVACNTGEGGNDATLPPVNDSDGAEDTPTEEPMPELEGDSRRGGLLYDKWWSPLGLDSPTGDHPLWATQDTNSRSGGDTWRCKECHGWDYKGVDGAYGSGSHYTGFTGIIHWAGMDAVEILAALKGGSNPDHDFSTVMDEQALIDIALFISQDMIDFADFIGEDKMALSADLTIGEQLWNGTCARCHGPQGLAINFKSVVSGSEYISGLSNGNPWEFFHKMRFGQPGVATMPPAISIGWTFEEQAAILAWAQSLPASNPVAEGGLLYDKWWKALGIDAPAGDHPLWATQTANTRSGADTWRCKECHGWDYKGADGAYGSGSHFTGFGGVLGVNGLSEAQITAWLDGSANPDHDFSTYLDADAISLLVSFLQLGTFDMAPFIGEEKAAVGDPANGQKLYIIGCVRCHGSDGTGINFGDDTDPEYLADIAIGNPWEFLHKAGNGQPGSHMTIGFNMGWITQDLADILAYIQSLW